MAPLMSPKRPSSPRPTVDASEAAPATEPSLLQMQSHRVSWEAADSLKDGLTTERQRSSSSHASFTCAFLVSIGIGGTRAGSHSCLSMHAAMTAAVIVPPSELGGCREPQGGADHRATAQLVQPCQLHVRFQNKAPEWKLAACQPQAPLPECSIHHLCGSQHKGSAAGICTTAAAHIKQHLLRSAAAGLLAGHPCWACFAA